jgi:hypothetical protein
MVETRVERRLLSYFRKISFSYNDSVIPIENTIFLSVSDSMRTMFAVAVQVLNWGTMSTPDHEAPKS